MWILLAFGSAFFAGVTAILAKCGIRQTDSDVATAIRTIVVLAVAWLMVLIVGSGSTIGSIDGRSWLFLILSGLATGASWLCYFRALQLGDVNKVVPVDKSSIVLAILLAIIFFNEELSWLKSCCIGAIALGTWLMIDKKPESSGQRQGKGWLFYALASAVFAALTSILAKAGMSDVEANLGTAIRTGIVLLMAWLVVAVKGKLPAVKAAPKKELFFICLSGLATGASWLCYFRALQLGPASVVMPIDKLSILVTIAFSAIVFKERLSLRAGAGLALIVAGTLLMLV